jgi:hypothetical protein
MNLDGFLGDAATTDDSFAAWIAGVYCPPLQELPKMRPSGTPRDLVTAVPCPEQLPEGATAAWLTGVLYAGAQLGPTSVREVGRGAIVHSVEKIEDVSAEEGSKSCYELTVTYGRARGRGVLPEEIGLPSRYVLKLYTDNVVVTQTARSNDAKMNGKMPMVTPRGVTPFCYWASLAPAEHCCASPMIDPKGITLEMWLRDREWCGFGAIEAREKVRAEDALAAAGGGSDFETQASESAVPTDYTGSDYGSASPRSSDAGEGKFTLKLPGVMEGEEQYERPLVEFDDDGDDEIYDVLIVDRYAKELRRVLGARPTVLDFMRVLEPENIGEGSLIKESHLNWMLERRDALLSECAPRKLHAAVLVACG